MQIEYVAYISIIITSYILVLSIGIMIGKYFASNNDNNNINGFLRQNKKNKEAIPKNEIVIDDTKVVLDIQTDKLEKKFTEIATTVETDNNIKSSVNKLKNMKGK